MKKEGPSLSELLADPVFEPARAAGRERVLRALKKGVILEGPLGSDADCWRELLSYPISRMLVSGVADAYLIRRYALAESQRVSRELHKEDEEFIMSVCNELGMNVRFNGMPRIHFKDYLENSVQMRSPRWKLINQRLGNGFVEVSRNRLIRLIQQKVQNKIERELPLPVTESILKAFGRDIAELERVVSEKKEKLRVEDLGKIRFTRFPPCMKELVSAVQTGKHISHSGRFAVTAFLHSIGLSLNDIFNVFALSPDFDERKTRYQIEHISGEISGTEYTPPECSTMKSYGLCPGPDELCRTINHPLSYYRAKGKKTRA